jgi:hypothetical protein
MQSAWERVRENAGCPGVDGVTVEKYQRQAEAGLPELLGQALDGAYRPLPLRKLVVEKKAGSGKVRTLMVPAVRDRILQTAVARLLSRSWEEEFLDASYAYRPERGVDRAVARILQLRDRGWTCVLDADITWRMRGLRRRLRRTGSLFRLGSSIRSYSSPRGIILSFLQAAVDKGCAGQDRLARTSGCRWRMLCISFPLVVTYRWVLC